jgi:hypothetical protein
MKRLVAEGRLKPGALPPRGWRRPKIEDDPEQLLLPFEE